MSSAQPITQIAEELRQHLDTLLLEVVREPLNGAVSQFTVILERPDLSMEQKQEMVRILQRSILTPLVSVLVSTAQASGIELASVLFHMGDAWEQVRAERMSKIAQSMIGKNNEETP